MIVFAAIMLHKAPAAFGLVSFLIHEGLDRTRVRRHLTIFALAAPVMTIVTFLALKINSDMNMVNSDSTGLCMLFSAGTFLYVSTVHVLPEVQSHNEDHQFRPSEMLSFIVGAILPLFMSMGHSH
jgi:zinc transporter 9